MRHFTLSAWSLSFVWYFLLSFLLHFLFSQILHTTMGDIHMRLYPEECPKTVENFTTHCRNGYYDNLIFHRVIKGFMVQTGDPLGDGTGGQSIWGREFEDEFHKRFVIFFDKHLALGCKWAEQTKFHIIQTQLGKELSRLELNPSLKFQLELAHRLTRAHHVNNKLTPTMKHPIPSINLLN